MGTKNYRLLKVLPLWVAFFFVLKMLIYLHISWIMRTFAVGKQRRAVLESIIRSIKKSTKNLVFLIFICIFATNKYGFVVELVDTRDLKSLAQKWACGFESHRSHNYLYFSFYFIKYVVRENGVLFSCSSFSSSSCC